MNLPHSLDRTVTIRAGRETVFSFFTESSLFAAWWGAGSSIDARSGGEVVIRYPNGVTARGRVVEVEPTRRIVFTFGYESGQPIPYDGSLVTITLHEEDGETLVRLRHEFADADARDAHVPGWRYQLSLFANVAASHEHSNAERTVDAFFACWAETDATALDAGLRTICSDDVEFRDGHASLRGLADLCAHIEQSQRFMPNIALRRTSAVRQCQGTVLVNWVAVGSDGAHPGGTNVFELEAGGRIRSVAGIPESKPSGV